MSSSHDCRSGVLALIITCCVVTVIVVPIVLTKNDDDDGGASAPPPPPLPPSSPPDQGGQVGNVAMSEAVSGQYMIFSGRGRFGTNGEAKMTLPSNVKSVSALIVQMICDTNCYSQYSPFLSNISGRQYTVRGGLYGKNFYFLIHGTHV